MSFRRMQRRAGSSTLLALAEHQWTYYKSGERPRLRYRCQGHMRVTTCSGTWRWRVDGGPRGEKGVLEGLESMECRMFRIVCLGRV